MSNEKIYIVMSPCYELLRYGHDLIKRQTTDAHAVGKFSKFVFGLDDLLDPLKPPTPDNYKFEACQAEEADEVVFVDRNESLKMEELGAPWGRRKRRVIGRIKKSNEFDK